ncbi:hypothetical protein H2203_002550 [Taxawa tesnikishii (nom. ined.)]|nr:hypothetical protein H2203_002550 [Dothideales sp. JES 119]
MLGTRIRNLGLKSLTELNFIRMLVFALYFLAIGMVMSTTVLESDLDLFSRSSCSAAIYVCLSFYLGSKVVMQVFLVERAHAVRVHHVKRCDSWIWLISMLAVGIGFGSIGIIAFIYPLAEISVEDGKCRIGLPIKVTAPLLTFDILINVALTVVFICLLQPLLRFNPEPTSASRPTKYFRRLSSRLSIKSGLTEDQSSAIIDLAPAPREIPFRQGTSSCRTGCT